MTHHPSESDTAATLIKDIVYDDFYDFRKYQDGQLEVVLDIGAHIGVFTQFAALRHPRASVIALEPYPETYGYLQSNVALLSNVKTFNAAVAPCECKILPMQCPGFGSAHNFCVRTSESEASSVRGIALETLINDHLNFTSKAFLKSDCEGGEAAWIFDPKAEEWLSRFVQVGLEFHFSAVGCKPSSNRLPTKEAYFERFEQFKRTHDVLVDMTWTWSGPRFCGRAILTRT